MIDNTRNFVAFNQGNFEAFARSGQIWAEGVQEMTTQLANTARVSFEESLATFKAFSSVRSVQEAIDLQSTFARTALEKAIAEANKIADTSMKLTEKTLAPLTARVTAAVETFGQAA